MRGDTNFLFFLILFYQFEEEFLETREQYEKLLQGESMWNLKKSVTRPCLISEKTWRGDFEDSVGLSFSQQRGGGETELWTAAEADFSPICEQMQLKILCLSNLESFPGLYVCLHVPLGPTNLPWVPVTCENIS